MTELYFEIKKKTMHFESYSDALEFIGVEFQNPICMSSVKHLTNEIRKAKSDRLYFLHKISGSNSVTFRVYKIGIGFASGVTERNLSHFYEDEIILK